MRVLAITAALGLSLGLPACQPPQPPDKELPPEPQASAPAASDATQLRDAIQAPINKAKAAEQAMQDAAETRDAAIEDL